MAYSLARVGETVVYATDNLPMFDADFAEYDLSFPIQKVVDKTFAFPDLGQLDWVIVIPTGGISDVVYSAAVRCAGASGARIALMSFESPNWFNSLAHHKRSGLPWEAWRKSVAQGGLVLTIAREGIEPAREFYNSPHHRAAVEYAFWHPPINDLVADKVAPARGPRDKVVAFVRTQDAHKGAADLLRLDPHVFNGKLLSPVFGRSVEAPYLDALKRHYSHAGVAIEVHDRISDREKFELLAEAQLLLFPSYFEGFGYPVVEAAYMGVPSVAYDLPVVRETVGEAALYVPPGDHAAFSRAVEQALATEPGPAVRAKLRIDPDTLTAGLKLQRLLKSHLKLVVPFKNAPSPVQVEAAVREDVLADPVVQAHWRTALASHRFRELAGVVSAGGLAVTGKIETAGADATLRVAFGGKRLPAGTMVRSTKTEVKTFALDQAIGPIDSVEAACRIDVFEQGKVTASQVVPLRFTPDALFRADAWTGGPARQAYGLGGERVLLLCEFDRLISGGLETLALSELAARFRARGLPVTLVLETDRAAEALADCDLDADLLPLVDAVEMAPKGTAPALVNAPGGLTLAASVDLSPGLADGADILLELGEGLAPIAIRRSPRRPGSKPVAIDYAPTLLSSRAEARSKRRRVVIAGAAPKAGVDDGWRRLFEVVLPRAAAEIADAQVVIHRDLLTRAPDKDLIRRFAEATGWTVSAGDFSQLIGHARDAARVVAIDVGETPRDARLSALNGSIGTALVRLSTTGDGDCVAAVTEALGAGAGALETTSALGAAFAGVWPPPPADDPIQSHSLARAALAAGMGDGLVHAPTLGIGQTLALSAQSDAEADYLVSGWSPRYVDGSAMAASGALIAFNLDERPTGAVTLELLIRSKAPKNTMLKCAVALNGQDIGVISLDRPIAKLFSFPIAARQWRANGVQLLTFRPEPVMVENVEHTPLLLGLALMTYPAATDWTTFDKDQPIIELTRLDEGEAYPIRFQFRGDGSDHAMLGRGWGAQEPWHVWSVEPVATVMASGEATDGRPALVTIEAGALVTDVHLAQRVSLEANGASLGERRTTLGFSTRMAFAVSPTDLEFGLDGVVMRFADCVRPKDLGLSADARQLGVSLTEFAIELPAAGPLTCRLEPAGGAAREVATSLASFDHAAAIVRLTGKGDIHGTVIAGGGLTEARVQARASNGRWEAWLGFADLSPETNSLAIRFEPDDASDAADAVGLDGVEVWPVGPELQRPFELSVLYKLSISLDALLARPSVALSFGSEEDSAILVDGWSAPEQTFRWSSAATATIDLSRFRASADFILLCFDLAPFVYEGLLPQQTVEFGRGGAEIARAVLAKPGHAQIAVALGSAADGPGVIALRFPDAATPQALGLSADTRALGVQLFGLAFESAPADRVARVALDALKDGWTVSRSATTPSVVLVELVGPSDGAPTHLGLQGSGTYAAVTRKGDRASVVLALPGEILDRPEPAVIVEAGSGGGGTGFVEGSALAEVRARVREDA